MDSQRILFILLALVLLNTVTAETAEPVFMRLKDSRSLPLGQGRPYAAPCQALLDAVKAGKVEAEFVRGVTDHHQALDLLYDYNVILTKEFETALDVERDALGLIPRLFQTPNDVYRYVENLFELAKDKSPRIKLRDLVWRVLKNIKIQSAKPNTYKPTPWERDNLPTNKSIQQRVDILNIHAESFARVSHLKISNLIASIEASPNKYLFLEVLEFLIKERLLEDAKMALMKFKEDNWGISQIGALKSTLKYLHVGIIYLFYRSKIKDLPDPTFQTRIGEIKEVDGPASFTYRRHYYPERQITARSEPQLRGCSFQWVCKQTLPDLVYMDQADSLIIQERVKVLERALASPNTVDKTELDNTAFDLLNSPLDMSARKNFKEALGRLIQVLEKLTQNYYAKDSIVSISVEVELTRQNIKSELKKLAHFQTSLELEREKISLYSNILTEALNRLEPLEIQLGTLEMQIKTMFADAWDIKDKMKKLNERTGNENSDGDLWKQIAVDTRLLLGSWSGVVY